MEFVIKPYESAGPIKLGMKKEEVRSVVPEKPEDSHDIRGPYTDFFATLLSLYITQMKMEVVILLNSPNLQLLSSRASL